MLTPLRMLLLLIMMGSTAMAVAQDVNLDSLYGEYVTDDVRAQLDKFKELEIQLQQQEQERDISKENAEQILQALMQDEKDLQEKAQKIENQKNRKLEKDW